MYSARMLFAFMAAVTGAFGEPVCVSGVYPHLAMYNGGNECGTGAVVPWAGRLWVVTYAPHAPEGSDDKLYEIDSELKQRIRPESVGGTPANRFIHEPSGQLFIGPYAIDRERQVRVIPPEAMPGRLTGTARHLREPDRAIYYATMEEGFYEVDVRTLRVTELYPDGNRRNDIAGGLLPGYHGKGLYTGQGRLVYANNGERSKQALRNPRVVSGCLAEWRGGTWHVVRRNQFTEVTGPGGIRGNANPAQDPVWSVGWDHRSLILMLLDGGTWYGYRLPKASRAYDGAHGWNTEWPRIRDIGEDGLLMTMHGMFWRFPERFRHADSAGIAPRSSYLKVVGDFCRWGEHVVLGCDDAARSEFLNKRRAKGEIAGPGQSHSNLRFIAPEQLDHMGPTLGRGAVWMDDPVRAGERSEPFLFAGFAKRGVFLAHDSSQPVTFVFEVDEHGEGEWRVLREVVVPQGDCTWLAFSKEETGAWVRIHINRDCAAVTAAFQYAGHDPRNPEADSRFQGLATLDQRDAATGGWVRARGGGRRTLQFAAMGPGDHGIADVGYYEMDGNLRLRRVEDADAHAWLKQNLAVPEGVLGADAASVFYEEKGTRYRLPGGDTAHERPGLLRAARVAREVCTERDLFNAHGTLYELPAENAGGMLGIRPIATHNRAITDYCSYRGLLILTGVADGAPADNPHIIRSDDGRCALWVGEIDDLWALGKPRGEGGPWKDTPVQPGVPSDPYLMAGYDQKRVTLSHDAAKPVAFALEVKPAGGRWLPCKTVQVPAGAPIVHAFPDAFNADWVRLRVDRPCRATAWFCYT